MVSTCRANFQFTHMYSPPFHLAESSYNVTIPCHKQSLGCTEQKTVCISLKAGQLFRLYIKSYQLEGVNNQNKLKIHIQASKSQKLTNIGNRNKLAILVEHTYQRQHNSTGKYYSHLKSLYIPITCSK